MLKQASIGSDETVVWGLALGSLFFITEHQTLEGARSVGGDC